MEHLLYPGRLVLMGTADFLSVPVIDGIWVAGGNLGGTGSETAHYSWLLNLNPQAIHGIDPQDYGNRVGRLRWRLQLAPSNLAYTAVAPPDTDVQLHFGLIPVQNESSDQDDVQGIGYVTYFGEATPIAGSEYVVLGPLPNTKGRLDISDDFPMPPAGRYAMAAWVNLIPVFEAELSIRADLQFRTEDRS